MKSTDLKQQKSNTILPIKSFFLRISLMKKSKLTVQRVVSLWKTISENDRHSPRKIATKLSNVLGYNPISITLLAQQSSNPSVRSQAIQAYYYLMEEDMVRNSLELSVMG
jgi:hypothetical protein